VLTPFGWIQTTDRQWTRARECSMGLVRQGWHSVLTIAVIATGCIAHRLPSSSVVAMSSRTAHVIPGMTYASVNGPQLYYETRGSGRPLVLLNGGLMTIDLNWAPLLEPLAANRQVIAVELQGHGHTADTDRAMTIETLVGDVVALLDHLGIADVDLFGFSLGGLVAYAVALGGPPGSAN